MQRRAGARPVCGAGGEASDAVPDWEWGLSLTGYGIDGSGGPVRVAELAVEGNRIEYRRGELVEWYVNDEQWAEAGLHAGWPTYGDGRGGGSRAGDGHDGRSAGRS